MQETLKTKNGYHEQVIENNQVTVMGHENEMLDYLIKVTTAKLSSMGVNVEDLTLK